MTVQLSADVETPCYGKSRLFDSIHRADHKRAKAHCDACPALLACRRLLDDERANKLNGAGPVGTWAGQLVGRPGGQGRPSLPRACGTDRGYHQHVNADEAACGDCKTAHAAAERERVAS